MKSYTPPMKTLNPLAAPRGVSLVEVLVSMAIMSIGVILLSTLLPISILRTAQATQLTQAVFLRNNAEAAVESNLGILNNAQICGFQGYAVVDPLGYLLVGPNTTSTRFGSYSLAAPSTPIIRSSGGSFNVAQLDQTLAAGVLATAILRADQLATLPDSWSLVREDFVNSVAPNVGYAPPVITVKNSTTDLKVQNGYQPSYAQHRMLLFDTSAQHTAIRPIYQTAGSPPAAGAPAGSNYLSWQNVDNTNNSAAMYAPGLNFTPTKVRIESQTRHFTWLMTVRKRWVPNGLLLGPDGLPGIGHVDDDNRNGVDDAGEQHIAGSDDDPNWAAEIQLAVFFNRSFKANDETSYAVSQTVVGTPSALLGFDGAAGVAGVDDDGNGITDWTNPPTNTIPDPGEIGFLGSDDNRTVTVTLNTFANNPPFLKKGGYMLEPSQLKWYRISDLTPINSASTTANLLLDQDIRVPPGGSISQGIFMKGIVEVYSLGIRTGQQ